MCVGVKGVCVWVVGGVCFWLTFQATDNLENLDMLTRVRGSVGFLRLTVKKTEFCVCFW